MAKWIVRMNTWGENETYTFNNKQLEITWINPPQTACNSTIKNRFMRVETLRRWPVLWQDGTACSTSLYEIASLDLSTRKKTKRSLTFRNHAPYIQYGHAPLPSRCCILYIFFLTNISTAYFKHATHSPFFSSKCLLFHNATFFGSCIIHILHTECAKI
jgi:hypothetical protein